MSVEETALCRKLYEAMRKGRGVRLSADELEKLLHDDAVGTRITNAAANYDLGCDALTFNNTPTWAKFCALVRRREGEPE